MLMGLFFFLKRSDRYPSSYNIKTFFAISSTYGIEYREELRVVAQGVNSLLRRQIFSRQKCL